MKNQKKYYHKLVEKGEKALDPVNWLYNQTLMRYSWETFEWHMEKNELYGKMEFIKTNGVYKKKMNCMNVWSLCIMNIHLLLVML